MKYLFPSDNLLTAATGYTPYPESINVRTSADKSGGGVVTLTGGAIEDATYDVEIVNNTIVGTPTVSAPVFSGVGNPVMSALSASAAVAAQVFNVTLTDLGTRTTYAFIPFQGVTLQAASSGAGGNAITITVDESGITRTPTDYALIDPITKDNNEYVGDQWDFGAVVLNADGTIPSSAPRISFGEDPQVYRQYKEFADGRYVHRFSPAPVRDVQEGARVKVVTGSRTVTVTQGMAVDTFAGVETLYDLLSAIEAEATPIVQCVEPVTVNTSPGGMAMVEMSVRTVSYVQSIVRDGTVFVRNAELSVSVSADAPTEVLTIRCTSADYIGAEVWSVRGTVSGELADAVTNVAYDGADYDFTIPEILPPSETPGADKAAYLDLLDRGAGDPVPVLCLENFVLGADARSRTFTYVWRPRPPECNCNGVDIEGGPDDDILGIDPEDAVSDTIPALLQTPLQTLYNWRKTFIGSNAAFVAPGTAVTGDSRIAPAGTVLQDMQYDTIDTSKYARMIERVSAILKVDRVDIDAANQATAIFHSALRDIYDTLTTVPAPAQAEWDAAETQMETDFSTLLTNTGADWFRNWSAYVENTASGVTPNDAATHEAEYAARLLTADFDAYLERYRSWMDKVRVLAGVEPDFNGATRRGNNVWQDHGLTAWFESTDGLLPIQPGYYYHSCKLGEDDMPVSTREFGIGVGIGCPEAMLYGDKLIITISPTGNIRVTYQVGDAFEVRVINGSAIQLGGGQTGTDTQTWRVYGSTVGALADYSLYTPAPVAYSASGLGFLITPGGIDSALGDEFEFYIEGGQFRYRKNGGAWSANTQIAGSVAIDSAGGANVRAQFATGAAPSFVIGDSYSFSVVALNTVERICSPVHGGAFYGDGGTPMRITYDSHMLTSSLRTVLFVRNREGNERSIDVEIRTAVSALLARISLTVQPGDNMFDLSAGLFGFATAAFIDVLQAGYTPTDETNEWQMLWIGHPVELAMPSGVIDPGVTRKRVKLGNRSRSIVRLGANVVHSAVAESAFDDFIERLNDATVNHDGRFAVVWPAGTQSECGIVRFAGDEIEAEDEFDYQPEDSADRLLKFTLPLEAVA